MTVGILLVGGRGTRLAPITSEIPKPMLPIAGKPVTEHQILAAQRAGITTLVLATSYLSDVFIPYFGDGSKWGLEIQLINQERPAGIAECFRLIPSEYQYQNCVVALGDNIFYGMGLGSSLSQVFEGDGSLIFAHEVSNPEDYGVIVLDHEAQPVSIQEKPTTLISNFAIPGLYYFDENCFEMSKSLQPSVRGELEITDLLKMYLDKKQLTVKILARGTAWLDTGSPQNLIAASNFVKVIEDRQGLKVGCPEEIALNEGFITPQKLQENILNMPESNYKDYLKKILLEKIR